MRSLLWLWLGVLIGTMGFFGALSRVVFEVVPQPEIAGHLVRRTLGPTLAIGAVSGVALAGLGAALRRGWLVVALPLLISIACIVNQFGVSRAVAEIELNDPALPAGMAARFGTLHQLSVWLFMAAAAIAVLLAVIHLWVEARGARGIGPSASETR